MRIFVKTAVYGKVRNMIKPIMRDVLFLGQKSEPATKEDIGTGRDLQDTLKAHREECVGMAANMIGVKKNIIINKYGICGCCNVQSRYYQ